MSVFWDSIDGLSRMQSWLNLTLAIAGVAMAVLAVVGYLTNQRLDTLKAARETADQARLEAAESSARAAQERANSVARQQQPRRLEDAQIAVLRQSLTNVAPGRVVFASAFADPEAEAFATQLRDIFLAAGWTPEGVNLSYWTPAVRGAFLVVHDGQAPPAHAGLIQAAFRRIGVDVPGMNYPELAADVVEIRIGHKP